MDSVLIHFAGTDFEEIEAVVSRFGFYGRCVGHEDVCFYLDHYPADDYSGEYSAQECECILTVLGESPSCSVVISARRGDAARLALRVVAELMEAFPASVLDDDNDHLHAAEDVRQIALTCPAQGIFVFYPEGSG
jgi:hypothetical protein